MAGLCGKTNSLNKIYIFLNWVPVFGGLEHCKFYVIFSIFLCVNLVYWSFLTHRKTYTFPGKIRNVLTNFVTQGHCIN